MMSAKPDQIPTTRLCLRPFAPADADAVTGLLTHPQVGKTYMVPDFASREEAEPLFRRLLELSLGSDRFVYGIYFGDIPVGMLNDVEVEKGRVELGYIIHPAYWNRGFATEALAAAMDALFRMGFHTVITGAFEENIPSIRVMEKCGMTRVARSEEIPYRGAVHHCIFYKKSADR